MIDRIHKRVQLFLHSCNITSIEDVELGALAEFGELHKKVEMGEWMTMTPGWADRPIPKEEGLQNSDGRGNRFRISGGGGGQDSLHNIRVDTQLQVIDKLGEIPAATRSENLRFPLATDGRWICLCYHSKV